jgi:hypothetical protein
MPKLPKDFRAVYRYRMQHGKPRDMKVLDNELWQQSSVVYVRVTRRYIVYIGSTDGVLRRRIEAHIRGISKSSAGKAKEFRSWAEGKVITILAYKPPPVKLLGLEVNVHRAVEAALIREFRSRGRSKKPWFVARI